MRLLIIEDDLNIRDPISDYLATEGYDVLVAADGMEAAQLLTHPNHVEVLLTDVRLGG